MQIRAFHGTNQTFETFSLTPPRRNTNGASADQGVFFTLRRETAEIYARMADGKFWAGDHDAFEAKIRKMVVDAERAMAAGDFARGERLYEDAERLEADGRVGGGAILYEVEIDAARPKRMEKCGDLDLDVMADRLAQAFADGHDVVVLEDLYEPVSGTVETQIVLRDVSRARIVTVEPVDEIARDLEDEAPSPF